MVLIGISLICISIYIKCGNCFQDGDKRKVSRDRGTLFFFFPLILPTLYCILEEIFNVLFCRTGGVLG